VSGTKSLCDKVRATLASMPDGAELAACVSDLSGTSDEARTRHRCALGASTMPGRGSRGALFVADNRTQFTRVTELLQALRDERQRDDELPCDGQFLLFLDEADAMQRTDGEENEPIQLERRLTTLCGGMQNAAGAWCPVLDDPTDSKRMVLGKPAGVFNGPQALVAISATLLPVFMRSAARAKSGAPAAAAVHPFYTEPSMKTMEQYVGVLWDKWLPLKAEDGTPVHLLRGDLNFRNNSIDPNVTALYADAASRQRSLLLDISVSRVNTATGTVRARVALCGPHEARCFHASILTHGAPCTLRRRTVI
jgi:hypothetical protein